MSNFVYDNTSLVFPKTNLFTVPPGGDPGQYLAAGDWNTAMQALLDVRGGLLNAQYFGFAVGDSVGLSTAGTARLRFNSGNFLEASVNGGAYAPITPPSTGDNATWSLSVCRYYLIDYDGGNDGNVGYVDAAPGSTITPTGKALKTIERFHQIFPKVGSGRMVAVLVKPRSGGATYKKQDGVTDDGFNFTGVNGYAVILRRGSTDLTNSASDRISLGAIIASTGPNGDSSWTVGSGSTSSITINAGTLPTTDSLVGYRIRFTPTTTTTALRNVCGFINAQTSGVGTITIGGNLGTSPVNGDTFWIERPGVRIASFKEADSATAWPLAQFTAYAPTNANDLLRTLSTVGFAGTSSSMTFTIGASAQATYSFVEVINGSATSVVGNGGALGTVWIQDFYQDETGAVVVTGAGLRSAGRVGIKTLGAFVAYSSAFLWAPGGDVSLITQAASIGVGGKGSYFAGGVRLVGGAAKVEGGASTFGYLDFLGAGSVERRTRLIGNLAVNMNEVSIYGVNITGAGSSAAIALGASSYIGNNQFMRVAIDDVVGSSGNTRCGIDTTAVYNCTLRLGTQVANTVTGSLGDIIIADSVVLSHSYFTKYTRADAQGNQFVGTGKSFASAADWDPSLVRYYFVDYDGGGDGNIGYVDATAGATVTTTGSLKTLERLFQILPRHGNGRKCVILIKPRSGGATYKKQDTITDDDLDFTGVTGYASGFPFVRGSDLTNSATDKIVLGARIAIAGPGAGSSFAVDTATTSGVTIASGSFGSTDTAVGFRLRLGTTEGDHIVANTSTSLTVSPNMSGTPNHGDTIYVDRPGVLVSTVTLPANQLMTIAGIGFTSTSVGALRALGQARIHFCEGIGSTTNATFVAGSSGTNGGASEAGSLVMGRNYTDETGTDLTRVGPTLRIAGGIIINFNGPGSISSIAAINSSAPITISVSTGQVATNSYFAKAPTLVSTGGVVIWSTNSAFAQSTRCVSGGLVISGPATVQKFDITNAGATPALTLTDGGLVTIDGVTGSSGNTDVGIDVSGQYGKVISLGTSAVNTVTGSVGDVRTAGSIFAHTYLAKAGYVDRTGNIYLGVGGLNTGTALWNPTLVRYYLLDYDGGDDTHIGYVDAAAGATLTPTGLAIKTAERLFQILPKYGNGRQCVILIKPRSAGATYKKQDTTTDDDLDFTGISGYGYLLRRGSTDLTNSAADHITLGAIQAVVGPNGDGSFPISGGATVSSFTVSSGSLGSTDAVVGCRVRFKGDVTGALANVCGFINANTGTVVTIGTDLGTAPAAGDSVYIEKPGVVFAGFKEENAGRGGPLGTSDFSTPVLAGIAFNTTTANRVALGIAGGNATYSFVHQTGATSNIVSSSYTGTHRITLQPSYPDESGTARSVGVGALMAGASRLQADLIKADSIAYTCDDASGLQWDGAPIVMFSGGSYVKGQVILYCRFQNNNGVGKASTSQRRTRFVPNSGNHGGLIVFGPTAINGIDFSAYSTLLTGTAAISLGTPFTGQSGVINPGVYGCPVAIDDCIGSLNAGCFGIDVRDAYGMDVAIGQGGSGAVTVTGSAGDIRIAGGTFLAYTALATYVVRDNHGNVLKGAGNTFDFGGDGSSSQRVVANELWVRKEGTANRIGVMRALPSAFDLTSDNSVPLTLSTWDGGAYTQRAYIHDTNGNMRVGGTVSDPNVKLFVEGRFGAARGADVASAGDMTLGTDGTSFKITGTTTINTIIATNWQPGLIPLILVSSGLTVKNNGTGAGAKIFMKSGGDLTTSVANTPLLLYYDGTQFFQM